MQFSTKFGKIICWRPLQGWRPLLWGILDPPLISIRGSTPSMNQNILKNYSDGSTQTNLRRCASLPPTSRPNFLHFLSFFFFWKCWPNNRLVSLFHLGFGRSGSATENDIFSTKRMEPNLPFLIQFTVFHSHHKI